MSEEFNTALKVVPGGHDTQDPLPKIPCLVMDQWEEVKQECSELRLIWDIRQQIHNNITDDDKKSY